MDPWLGRQGLSLDRLRALHEVAEAGGIARAAPGQPVRQSQLSRQLKELEDFFGTALTARAGRRPLELTDAGRQLAVIAREVFQSLSDFQRAQRDERATFALGAGDSLLHWWALPRLGRLRTAFPRVDVRVASLPGDGVVRAVREFRLDAGLVRADAVGARGLRELSARPLGTLAHALFVPRPLLGARQRATAATVLATSPVALQTSDVAFATRVRDWAAAADASLHVALDCETFPQACRAVQSDAYAAVLPTLARGELPAARYKRLALPGFDGGDTGATLHLVHHPRLTALRPFAADFVAALARTLQL